jgi:hypothetical protein
MKVTAQARRGRPAGRHSKYWETDRAWRPFEQGPCRFCMARPRCACVPPVLRRPGSMHAASFDRTASGQSHWPNIMCVLLEHSVTRRTLTATAPCRRMTAGRCL